MKRINISRKSWGRINFPNRDVKTPKKMGPGDAYSVARYYESIGDIASSIPHWSSHFGSLDRNDPSWTSILIEFAYSIYYLDGQAPQSTENPITIFLDEWARWVSFGGKRKIDRAALFKGIDILKSRGLERDVPAFLALAGASMTDHGLMSKFLGHEVERSDIQSWVTAVGIPNQKISIYNNFLPLALQASGFEYADLFLVIRRMELEVLTSEKAPRRDILYRAIGEYPNISRPSDSLDSARPESSFWSFYRDPAFETAASLALHHPKILFDIYNAAKGPEDFCRKLEGFSHLIPRYVIATGLGYPMGGGESFMHQSCMLIESLGVRCFWISFNDKMGRAYEQNKCTSTPFYEDIRVAGGFNREKIRSWLRYIGPDMVHTQGPINAEVALCADQEGINCLIGYHFWTGLVALGVTGNANIEANAWAHRLGEVPSGPFIEPYVASEFMLDVYKRAGGTRPLDVIHPIPDPSHYRASTDRLGDKVVQINLARGKGGAVFRDVAKALASENISFLGVHSETVDDTLMTELEALEKGSSRIELSKYRSASSIYEEARIVIIPTQVDETFCRVAYEAAANGIPVVSTRAGFLPHLLGDTGIYLSPDKPEQWIDLVRDLYSNPKKLRAIGAKQKERVLGQFGEYPVGLTTKVVDLLRHSSRKKVGIITAWADQGLGYQARHYGKVLREAGFGFHVLAYRPYSASSEKVLNQADPADWSCPNHADSVYYSLGNREKLSATEIVNFSRAKKVGCILYPEICWEDNWRTVREVLKSGLRIYGVPNLETVRSSEMRNHAQLEGVLCPTRAVEHILYASGVKNVRYIGHGFGDRLEDNYVNSKADTALSRNAIRYLHIGGHNPRSRKNTALVIEAFRKARATRDDIILTVAIMDRQGLALPEIPGLTYLEQAVSSEVIAQMYARADVSVQVSSHEGIGLGFYESVSKGTPVISLDVPPHNEVVRDQLSGWLVEAQLVPLSDNDDPISRAAKFDVDDLAHLFETITNQDVARLIRTTASFHARSLTDRDLMLRMVEGLAQSPAATRPLRMLEADSAPKL